MTTTTTTTTTTRRTYSLDDKALLLSQAEQALSLMRAMNAWDAPLALGFTPTNVDEVRSAGGFWHAQELLSRILVEYTGSEDLAKQVMEVVLDSGESVSYSVKYLDLHHATPNR